MPDERPPREPIDEAILIFVPSLQPQYQAEKERHSAELKTIETMVKDARARIKRVFQNGPIRDRKLRELDTEYTERAETERERHADFLQDFKETIKDYATPGWDEEAG